MTSFLPRYRVRVDRWTECVNVGGDDFKELHAKFSKTDSFHLWPRRIISSCKRYEVLKVQIQEFKEIKKLICFTHSNFSKREKVEGQNKEVTHYSAQEAVSSFILNQFRESDSLKLRHRGRMVELRWLQTSLLLITGKNEPNIWKYQSVHHMLL